MVDVWPVDKISFRGAVLLLLQVFDGGGKSVCERKSRGEPTLVTTYEMVSYQKSSVEGIYIIYMRLTF